MLSLTFIMDLKEISSACDRCHGRNFYRDGGLFYSQSSREYYILFKRIRIKNKYSLHEMRNSIYNRFS